MGGQQKGNLEMEVVRLQFHLGMFGIGRIQTL
jgi:hypothetical protein